MPLSLSDFLGIERSYLEQLGCFDTILDIDSRFFINFMRLRLSKAPEMQGAYSKVLEVFDNVGILLRASKHPNDRFWREAYNLLTMSELEEICLGYSVAGTSGAGSGKDLKQKILATGKAILDAGIEEPEIFELVGLFEEGIGPDRISDMIGRIVKPNLVSFSRRILEKLRTMTAIDDGVEIVDGIIINPFSRKPLYMLPKELLHELPVAREWDDIDTVCALNAELRQQINNAVGDQWRKLTVGSKKRIALRILIRNPDILRGLIEDYKAASIDEYDFNNDPLGEAIWYTIAKDITIQLPLSLAIPTRVEDPDIIRVVREICKQFKKLIEVNGVNEILYYKTKPRRERTAQRVFYAVADSYCKSNNLDLSPEANSGRGAIDFKMSKGYTKRVLVEVKLTTNNRLIHGLERQLAEYQSSENLAYAFYLVIDNGGPAKRTETLIDKYAEMSRAATDVPEMIIVDGLLKNSASII